MGIAATAGRAVGIALNTLVAPRAETASILADAGLEPVATLLLWLYFTGAAILIGGEANSEIEKAASKAGQSDVRGPSERGGNGSCS